MPLVPAFAAVRLRRKRAPLACGMSLSQKYGSQPRWLILAELWTLTALLGWIDQATGWELSLFVFYGVPIFAAAWYVDRNSAFLLALAGSAVWWWANVDQHPYASDLAYLWAAASRLAYFVFVAIGAAALSAQNGMLRSRLQALERAAHLERELVRVSENEQRRIGQDLHDGLCQTLAAIGFAVASLREDLSDGGPAPAKVAPAADAISGMVRSAIAEARGMARGIFPVQMNEVGLPVALHELAESTGQLKQMPVVFESHGDVRVSDPEIGMHLYRIAQEALSNALTHAGATRIAISLRLDEDELRLMVSDDGAGFAPNRPESRGMGLGTMKYRASIIGANLDVHSESAGGTIVSCVLPTEKLAAHTPSQNAR